MGSIMGRILGRIMGRIMGSIMVIDDCMPEEVSDEVRRESLTVMAH